MNYYKYNDIITSSTSLSYLLFMSINTILKSMMAYLQAQVVIIVKYTKYNIIQQKQNRTVLLHESCNVLQLQFQTGQHLVSRLKQSSLQKYWKYYIKYNIITVLAETCGHSTADSCYFRRKAIAWLMMLFVDEMSCSYADRHESHQPFHFGRVYYKG